MEGLEKFREAFEAYSDNYVIIGGTACDITMTGTTVRPRATHDIDMIVVVEKMTADFGRAFLAIYTRRWLSSRETQAGRRRNSKVRTVSFCQRKTRLSRNDRTALTAS